MKIRKLLFTACLILCSWMVLPNSAASAETQSGRALNNSLVLSGTTWESAYRQIISRCFQNEQQDRDAEYSPSHYTLSDIDKDGVPELIIGLKHVSYSTSKVYTFTGGRAVLLGEITDAHGFYAGVPGDNGVLYCYEGQGSIFIQLWKIEHNTLVSSTVYDKEYDGDFFLPYPYPSAFCSGARILPESLCDDLSVLHLYGAYSGSSLGGSSAGFFPNNDTAYYTDFLKSSRTATIRFLEKPYSESEVLDLYSRYGKGAAIRGDELLEMLDAGAGRSNYHLSYIDLNGDGILEAVVCPEGWCDILSHTSERDKLFPLILSEKDGSMYAYAYINADAFSDDGVFLWRYAEDMYDYPFRLCFSGPDCCKCFLREDSFPGLTPSMP